MAKNPTTGDDPQKTSRFALSPRLLASLILVIVAIVFIVENKRKTEIRFLVPDVRTSLSLALLIAAALGFIAGLLVARSRSRK